MAKSTKNLEKKLTFRLKVKDLKFLDDVAEKEGLTVSFLVRRLVLNFIEHKKQYQGHSVK